MEGLQRVDGVKGGLGAVEGSGGLKKGKDFNALFLLFLFVTQLEVHEHKCCTAQRYLHVKPSQITFCKRECYDDKSAKI